MSISHWGFFPGYYVLSNTKSIFERPVATWTPCSFDHMVAFNLEDWL